MMSGSATRRDRKGREYIDLGRFGGGRSIHVYFSKPAKGQRREESARVVLVGHVPELRVAVDPWKAKQLDRAAALLVLWDRLVQLIDDKAAPTSAANEFETMLSAEGLALPVGPLHRPGLPKLARLILAYRQAHPAASQRMVAAAVGCDPGRVCQVYRKYGDPASEGAERSAECALNIQRGFSADSAREQSHRNGANPGENGENGNRVPVADSAPPLCTSSSLREEDDGAPPPDAGVPRPAHGGPPRPVVAGNVESNQRPARYQPTLPPGFEVVVEELRPLVWAVVTIDVADPGRATLWAISQRVPKPEGLLDRAVELGYLDEGRNGASRGAQWWVPRHPRLVDLVERLRSSKRGAAS